jgi:hypothetical protein
VKNEIEEHWKWLEENLMSTLGAALFVTSYNCIHDKKLELVHRLAPTEKIPIQKSKKF